MPRYYFHTEDGRCFPDDEGTELANTVAAKQEAARILGEMLKDNPDMLWDTKDLRLTVENADHLILFIIDTSVVEPPSLRPI
jgi:hypothetical protein